MVHIKRIDEMQKTYNGEQNRTLDTPYGEVMFRYQIADEDGTNLGESYAMYIGLKYDKCIGYIPYEEIENYGGIDDISDEDLEALVNTYAEE